MTFGELKSLNWLKFDRNAVDVLIRINDYFLRGYIVRNANEDKPNEEELVDRARSTGNVDELWNIMQEIFRLEHYNMFEYTSFGGNRYYDVILNEDNSPFLANNTYDDYIVVEVNLSSFKRPTIILETN